MGRVVLGEFLRIRGTLEWVLLRVGDSAELPTS